jgi:streptogramin lyase
MTGPDANALVRFSLTTGELATYALPDANRGLREITTGADGNLWFTEFSTNQIGRLSLP